jgi:lysine-ketoglutarate reductase/saccharopine dehydrogenase-like protein (TIGR00300 family)
MPRDEKFFLCPPTFFGVEYVINPWMEGNVGRAQQSVAMRQWQALHDVLAGQGVVELVDAMPGLPDMPFTANAGLALDDIFIPSRFRFPQRQSEVKPFTEWFRRHGYRVVELPGQGTFEGEGDALRQPGESLLWGGYGVRTSLQVYPTVAELAKVEVVPLHLVDERFYHLDTCFCPLQHGEVLYYGEAFDADSVATIETRVPSNKRYAVETADALRLACNAVAIGDAIVMPHAGPALRAQLAAWGYEVIVCPVSEFLLAGGAVKCLVLRLTHRGSALRIAAAHPECPVREAVVAMQGHLLDRALLNRVLDTVSDAGGSFEVETFQPGLRHDQASTARVRLAAPSAAKLDAIVERVVSLGVTVLDEEADARLESVPLSGVAPEKFYGTSICPTDVRVNGHWVRAAQQRMDAAIVVDSGHEPPRVTCRLLRDLHVGDSVVCGSDGVRVQPLPVESSGREAFAFMGAAVSSERHVEVAVERLATEMQHLRARHGRIVVVAGPVVIHTGGGPHLASLIRRGYVQALLGGNGIAAHDIEQALFGTSLGVDLTDGRAVPGGHQHHLRAINRVRACGGIANAVLSGVITSGIFYECVMRHVPFALAGSIRDDGPLPDTLMDLIAAQDAYAHLLAGADMILMLASMLHAIGVGNMTPAGVRLICVDISPAMVTKLADRGSLASTGIVTDVGLFLNLFDRRLATHTSAGDGFETGDTSWVHSPPP